jgi:hypothetical protein
MWRDFDPRRERLDALHVDVHADPGSVARHPTIPAASIVHSGDTMSRAQ